MWRMAGAGRAGVNSAPPRLSAPHRPTVFPATARTTPSRARHSLARPDPCAAGRSRRRSAPPFRARRTTSCLLPESKAVPCRHRCRGTVAAGRAATLGEVPPGPHRGCCQPPGGRQRPRGGRRERVGTADAGGRGDLGIQRREQQRQVAAFTKAEHADAEAVDAGEPLELGVGEPELGELLGEQRRAGCSNRRAAAANSPRLVARRPSCARAADPRSRIGRGRSPRIRAGRVSAAESGPSVSRLLPSVERARRATRVREHDTRAQSRLPFRGTNTAAGTVWPPICVRDVSSS